MKRATLSECQHGIIKELRGDNALCQVASGEYCHGCKGYNLCHMPGSQEPELLCRNRHHLAVGSKVVIRFKATARLSATFWLFICPVIGFLAGGIIATAVWPHWLLMQILLALGCMLLAFIPVFLVEKRAAHRQNKWLPEIVKEFRQD